MKGHESKPQAQASGEEDGKVVTRSRSKKQKTNESDENRPEENKENEAAPEENKENDIMAEFEEFCKGVTNHLTVVEMRKILEANDQGPTGPDDTVIPRVADVLFFGPLGRCPMCKGFFEFKVNRYICGGNYSAWSKCPTSLKDPPRKGDMIKIPDGIEDDRVREWIKNRTEYPKRELPEDKPLKNMVICLSGRLSRRHDYWKQKIHKCGGEVARTSLGVACLVVPSVEGDRGGSNKTVDALEANVPIVSEQWLVDTVQNNEVQPLEFYDMKPYLAPHARGIAGDTPDPVDESMESLVGEVKLCGKSGIYSDSGLCREGGRIFEKDGIIYNCAFSLCDLIAKLNQFAVIQLIMMPKDHLHLYYKKSRVGEDPKAEERVEDFESRVDDAVGEFIRLFEELTGNEFEPWEREKKFEKKPYKFYPLDMDLGFDVRRHGLAPRKLGAAALHCKLHPLVGSVMKILCSREIYRYALMEMAHDVRDLPIGMLSNVHLKKCEQLLVNFREELKTAPQEGSAADISWIDFSNKWFTMMPSTMPFTIRGERELADFVAAGYETIKDINVASKIIGDTTGDTLDDPLSDRYGKIGCSISPLDKEAEDYKMIVNYLQTTYEPYKVDDVVYGVSVQNIFEVQANPSAAPTYEEVKKLPNKLLLWCGTRSSNIVRHLNKGFQPAVCQIPAPGYMFGRAIVCTDTSAEAAQYAFTGVDRPEGFLILAVFSQGEQVTEIWTIPEEEEVKTMEEKKNSVKGIGRKKTDESEHFTWKDDIKVPCGHLVSSDKDSPIEYNEYAVYDPKQVCMKFMVWVKYEEQNMEVDVPEAPGEGE